MNVIINLPATLALNSDNLGVVEFSLIDLSLFYGSRREEKIQGKEEAPFATNLFPALTFANRNAPAKTRES